MTAAEAFREAARMAADKRDALPVNRDGGVESPAAWRRLNDLASDFELRAVQEEGREAFIASRVATP